MAIKKRKTSVFTKVMKYVEKDYDPFTCNLIARHADDEDQLRFYKMMLTPSWLGHIGPWIPAAFGMDDQSELFTTRIIALQLAHELWCEGWWAEDFPLPK